MVCSVQLSLYSFRYTILPSIGLHNLSIKLYGQGYRTEAQPSIREIYTLEIYTLHTCSPIDIVVCSRTQTNSI